MATYPGGLPSFAAATDDVTDSTAALYNAQNAEIVAIATELGADVAGSLTDLQDRLAIAIADDGTLEFKDSTVLTISSGAVTASQNFHRIATEGDAGSDDAVLEPVDAGVPDASEPESCEKAMVPILNHVR